MIVGNRVEFLELSLGALMAGVWITPVNWHLTAEEAGYIVADSESRAGASPIPVYEDTARAAAGDRPVLVLGAELDAALAPRPAPRTSTPRAWPAAPCSTPAAPPGGPRA